MISTRDPQELLTTRIVVKCKNKEEFTELCRLVDIVSSGEWSERYCCVRFCRLDAESSQSNTCDPVFYLSRKFEIVEDAQIYLQYKEEKVYEIF